MGSFRLLLTAKSTGKPPATAEQPVWPYVEAQIEQAFQLGGTVELSRAQQVDRPREGLLLVESIHMKANPGRFRIVLAPARQPNERKTNLREWRETRDAPYQGTERFGDDDFDARSVCIDVSIAARMFKDFYDNGGVTETLLESTLSVWDQK